MDRGSKGNPATECKCGSSAGLDCGICVDCRREYGREYYRKKLAKNAAKGGPLIPRERRGFCLQKKKPTSFVAIAPSSRNQPSDGFGPIAPVLEVGRRIPAPDAPMAEKLECIEWLEYYERKGMLDWARREANLWQEA